MDEYQALSHTTWECKYHVVFIPKCRRKTLYLELRRHLGEVFHRLAAQKESKIEEGHLMPDHLPPWAVPVLKPPALPGDTYLCRIGNDRHFTKCGLKGRVVLALVE